MGYYLFDAIEENETKCLINSSEELLNESEYCDEDNDLMPQIIIRSLWYYWREVTAISIVSAFLLNFCYSLLKRKLKTIRKISESEEICTKSEHISESTAKTPSPSTPSFSTPFNAYNSAEHQAFNSRYESDFEPIQVLGRGGFGLVFEAKHIIDESHYAVKRIYLPVRKEQREKVMREVRALSKLDHSGIVRYYNAWVELPPPGWQEDKDQPLFTTEDIASTHFNESDVRYKQLVVNKTTATDLKTSFYYRESHEMSTETSFGFNKSKQIITKTQSNQSLDIVFDENVSSVKVIDKNSNESIGMSSDNNVFDSKSSESSDESKLNAKSNDLIENNRRPLNLNPVLPRCYLYIQMQLCRKDTLKDWLLNNSLNRDSNTVLDIFDQIVSAVHYVHSMGLMHRDLKVMHFI
ncbi:unnamed protein product [Medioppia subpectinata]|uniref:Protein kinase domain-containing protein n=1 Tax=Medioppia subpectinata TaxID=1979941 RepID=A0A7R9L4C6_9ACAR|nr:unnamed protein product [Medioppia subpectinata]CAG2115044.1 unnamed protein product [Medioppia subpectinata]